MRILQGLALGLIAGAASAQTIGIVTTPAGSFSNSAGQAMAKVLVDKAKLRSLLHYSGLPISSHFIVEGVLAELQSGERVASRDAAHG